MLISFTFSNFRSFRAPQYFTTERTEAYWSADEPYSAVSAIYGGNAAGKSNYVAALDYVSRFVRESFATASKGGTGRSHYRLGPSGLVEPSTFSIRFSAESREEYEYEFSVDDERVRYERLLKWGGSRPSKVFERRLDKTSDGLNFDIYYGKAFRGPRSIYRKALVGNALLLSVMASAGNGTIMDAFDFLAHRIHVYRASDYHAEMDGIALSMRDDHAMARAYQTLVRNSDLGISGIELDVSMQERLFDQLGAMDGEERLREFYSAFVNLTREDLPDSERSGMAEQLMRQNPFDSSLPPQVVFAHEGESGIVLFDERDESDGTIATLAFLSLALRDLSTQTVTVVDEIDSSLHPSMVQALVELYQDPLTNPHGSQIVFTTHDVSLLIRAVNGTDPIAPDQFWIVEKRGGESELYPASDYEIAEDENMARNYLNGRYGGVLRPRLRTAFLRALEILEDAHGEEGGRDGEAE